MKVRTRHNLNDREKHTLWVDLLNRIPDGIINQLIFSAFVLIAIKVYGADDLQKAILSSARNVGLMLGLITMPLLAKLELRKSVLTGVLSFLAGLFLLLAGVVRSSWGYTASLTLCAVLFLCRVPYMTSIYAHNYSDRNREVLYSYGMMAGVTATLFSTLLLGRVMDADPHNFRPVFIGIGAVTMGASAALFTLPSERLTEAVSPWRSFSVLLTDPYFGYFTLIWTIFGFAGLSIMAMQVIHLAEPERGLGFSSFQVLMITGVLSSLIRILFNRPMIRLFNKMDIYRFRLLVNLLIALGSLVFFFSRTPVPLVIFYTVFTIGFTGDTLMWGIFVTRVAPPGKTHIYMSVHTFGAGLRGILGPSLSYLFIQKFSLQQFGVISSSLILLSGLMTIPVIRGWWKLTPARDS